MTSFEESQQLIDWRAGRAPRVSRSLGTFFSAKRDEDSIFRLRLPYRVEQALLAAHVSTISLLVELADSPKRPKIPGLGPSSWRTIENALDRPFPPVEKEVAS